MKFQNKRKREDPKSFQNKASQIQVQSRGRMKTNLRGKKKKPKRFPLLSKLAFQLRKKTDLSFKGYIYFQPRILYPDKP